MQQAMASENSETAAEDALVLTEKVVPIIDADQPDLTAKSPAKISF